MRNCFFDVHKWHNDVKTEQVVLRILILIWEMYQSDWDNCNIWYLSKVVEVTEYIYSSTDFT